MYRFCSFVSNIDDGKSIGTPELDGKKKLVLRNVVFLAQMSPVKDIIVSTCILCILFFCGKLSNLHNVYSAHAATVGGIICN